MTADKFCLICKTPQDSDLGFAGGAHNAICLSCYLADKSWMVEDDRIRYLLESGLTEDEALIADHAMAEKEMQNMIAQSLSDMEVSE